jgi:hypothetical protein
MKQLWSLVALGSCCVFVASCSMEFNCDGVRSAIAINNNFPEDFFSSTDPAVGKGRKRELVYANSENGFRLDSSVFSETSVQCKK